MYMYYFLIIILSISIISFIFEHYVWREVACIIVYMYMETVPAFIENVQVYLLKLCVIVASNFLLVLEVRQR